MTKNVLAINGSPRKMWNTGMLLKKALEGAVSQGADTELVHLYDLDFKGCTSCFACRLKGGKSYGRCAVNDDLTPVLEKAGEADALILGSPVYFGIVTGEMRSFIERLLFPYLVYTNPPSTLFDRKINTAFIYTMNVSEKQMRESGYNLHIAANAHILGLYFRLYRIPVFLRDSPVRRLRQGRLQLLRSRRSPEASQNGLP